MRGRDIPGQLVSAAPDAIITYTPTITQGANTFSSVSCYVLALNGALLMWGTATAVSSVTAVVTITLPTNYVIRLPFANSALVGLVSTSGAVGLNGGTSFQTLASVALTGGNIMSWYAMVPVAALA